MLDQPTISRDEPLPADWSVERGLHAYLDESGFSVEAYKSKWTPASFAGIRFSVPNTPAHRRAIMFHDLHHVATGFGTDMKGEGLIAAWEIRKGLQGLGLYVGFIIVSASFIGAFYAASGMIRVWRTTSKSVSLFSLDTHTYEEFLAMSIGELRDLLGIEPNGLYKGRRGLDSLAPNQ